MARQLYCSVGKAFACRVRITALNNCRPVTDPATGQPMGVTLDCVSGISTDVARTDGPTVEPPRACPGKRCWRIKGCSVEEAITFSVLNFGTWDLTALQMMTGDALGLIQGNVAIGFDRLNDKPCQQFALEIWSQVGAGNGVCQSGDPDLWWYELYPNVINARISGQVRNDTTPNIMEFTNAEGYSNPRWGLGPYGVQPGNLPMPADSIERMMFWVDANGNSLPLPTPTCDEAATDLGLLPAAA